MKKTNLGAAAWIIFSGLLTWTCAAPVHADDAPMERLPIAAGPFKGDWESLKQYQTPEWFRDAKFGIWAHWSAQCVPEMGDWYARFMYVQGQQDYQYQCARYGHPSKFGFKDIDHLWRAENWDPDKLIALYKRAGAKYFVALANHHDNLDCYDSKYQPWNTVNVGPHKDIVGAWAVAARKAGLKFGVTVHAARAWNWYEPAQGSDKTGPLAGVRYDGVLTKADGKGLWWEGLDPQDLYAQNHPVGAKPSAAYINKFFNRTLDLIDKYQPDLLYFDDYVLPFQYDHQDDKVGLDIAAHYYNQNIAAHGGKLEAVLNGKILNEQQRKTMVWDIERGLADKVEPFVWQTDTCIGDWHYRRSLFENHQYKTADLVIHMLADIVSKNGNLLLNIPVRGDGTIDEDEIALLQEMAKWMDVNSEGIFGTRPWVVYGEGPSTEVAKPGAAKKKNVDMNEGETAYSADDIRFTVKGNTLYAIALGWPKDGVLRIKSLAAGSANLGQEITGIKLLGSDDSLKWTRQADSLQVTVPAAAPCDHAYVFKISLAPAAK
jgi:alpha-L-fucosidase